MSGGPVSPPRRIGPGATTRTFFRAFTIQGSWNYRTMIGNGFAFAMIPVLRAIYRDGELDEAVARHAEHFNAHPYLANLALGAVARMEAEGLDPDQIRRFKVAVKGPLGGLGDTLVWATLLPTTLLVALILGWTGAGPWIPVVLFLVLYNAGHLILRVWALRTGLRDGQAVAPDLRRAGLGVRAEELARSASLLVGVFVGLVLTRDPGFADPRWAWAAGGLAAVTVGLVGGQKVWRPAALTVVGSVIFICLSQIVL